MTKNPALSGKFAFSIDSSLLFQLGEQLVAKPSIAMAELVKNGYDADATKVTVTLENVGKSGGTILVEDNGHGMTFEEIENNWMRIATTQKREKRVSRIYCRPFTGAKGIGRFAARRLGEKLTLQSIAERDDGSKESVTVEFDWNKSFSPGEDLIGVPVSYTRQKVAPNAVAGVSLLISGVRDSWAKDEIIALRRDLLSLQSPFPDLILIPQVQRKGRCQKDPGFDFELIVSGAEDSEELRKLSGGLGEAFLDLAWARLDGKVDQKGRARYSLAVLRAGEKDSLIDHSNNYEGLEDARFRIYFMVYSTQYFAGASIPIREAQRKGREEGGVRIYLNQFRVFPYGDEGDDWLKLDYYASRNIDMAKAIGAPETVTDLAGSVPGRPFLLIPKNQQVFGVVALSQAKHSNVEVNVSRERLIETPTVEKLRHFVQNGIYWMTIKYAAFVAEEQAKRRTKRRQTVPEAIEEVKATIVDQTGIPEERRQLILFSLDKAIEQAKEEEADRISEISMLRILASAGTTIILMNHQLQALIGAVSQTEEDLRRLRPEIPKNLYKTYDDIVVQVSEWHELVELQVSQLRFLLSPDNRQRRKHHPLYEVVEHVRKPMTYYMNRYGVHFSNNVPRSLRTPPIYLSELYAVLINVFSNALKAVYEQPKREIAVEAEKVNGTVHIRMKDTGVGLPASRREISFKPFVTTSVPNPVLGVGTGLGLKVVSDILELYDGTARFIDTEEPWKTCIEIVLPDREDK